MSNAGRRRFSSWKEISAYLGREVRTVARWERERGLPVHRVPGGKGRSVFAYSDELDSWLTSSQSTDFDAAESDPPPAGESVPDLPAPSSPEVAASSRARPRLLLWAAAALASAAVVGVATKAFVLPHPVVSIAPRAGELVGLDRAGRQVWNRRFDAPVTGIPLSARWWDVLDFEGDGSDEIVTALQQEAPQKGLVTEDLYALTNGGRVLWQRRSNDRLVFRSGEYTPPWFMDAVIAYRVEGRTRVAWAQHHQTWWPGLLTILDEAGVPVSRFVNSGWILSLNASADGRVLAAAGVNNARDAYMMAIFDGRHVTGASPEDHGSAYECLSCDAGRPMRYFIFPRSEVNAAARFGWYPPQIHILPDGRLELHLGQVEGNMPSAEAIYELSSSFELLRARMSDVYWDWHRRLSADGRLDHPVERCAERIGLPVRWMDQSGEWHQDLVRSW
jgi:hypothetical protein